jgi:hypothetical protein
MINQPALASVPMNSMLLFASVSFGAMTYLVVRLVGVDAGRDARAGWSVGWRTVLAGAATPLAMIVVSAPSGAFRGEDQLGIQRTILSAELAVVWIAGLYLLVDAGRATRTDSGPIQSPVFARIYPAVYLGVLVALWLTALPAYLASSGGVTEQGTPVGSLWYAALCAVAAAVFILAAVRVRAPRPAVEPVGS